MNRKKGIFTIALFTLMMISGAGVAESKEVGGGPNPFTDCGIGAALFNNKDTQVLWAAVTSNVIWDLGTTAVTSATMSPETCSAKNVKTAQFILETYPKLAEETATGQGEHLTTVLNKFGCGATDHQQIISGLRDKMATQVSQPDYQKQSQIEKSTHYFRALNAAAAGQCIS
ncbi:MAG: DUF3015 family protein [Magnetococcales bacterium]|nr:DUF3015 family protein [Magnetococcales bacterium]